MKFVKLKSEAFEEIREYVAERGTPAKFQSDNSKSYESQGFAQFRLNNKIKREFTVLETPQQNVVAERLNWSLVETTKCNL